MHIINEILQWIFLAVLSAPHVTRVVRDFREEDKDE